MKKWYSKINHVGNFGPYNNEGVEILEYAHVHVFVFCWYGPTSTLFTLIINYNIPTILDKVYGLDY